MTSQDVILGMLISRSLTGYEMKQLFESVFANFYNATFGTIYPMLAKMEKQGLITKESVIQQGKPNKNVYSITAEGKARFTAYLHSDIEKQEVKSDFMVRLYFGELAGRELVLEWLRQSIKRAEALLERLHGDYARWKPHLNEMQEICILLGIESAEASYRVLSQGLARIEAAGK